MGLTISTSTGTGFPVTRAQANKFLEKIGTPATSDWGRVAALSTYFRLDHSLKHWDYTFPESDDAPLGVLFVSHRNVMLRYGADVVPVFAVREGEAYYRLVEAAEAIGVPHGLIGEYAVVNYG